MAKILISALGVGPTEKDIHKREYKTAKYVFEPSGKEYETKFVAAALVEHLQLDKVILVGTSKSMWEEVYNYFAHVAEIPFDQDYWLNLDEKVTKFNVNDGNKLNEDELQKVNEAIDSYLKYLNPKSPGGSVGLIIDYGLNASELWNNLDRLMEIEKMLKDGDEIYLDITHAFRSIPIFLYLLMDFISTLSRKEIKLAGLFYGMLDVIKEKGYAPVVDLGPLFQLSQWIKATYDFINYGNGYLMASLITEEKGKSFDSAKKISNISDLININYLPDLKNQIIALQKNIGKIQDIPLFKYVEPNLIEFINRFSHIDSNHEFLLEMAEWYFENKRYGYGYICLVESILTALTDVYNLESNYKNKEMMKNVLYNKRFRNKTKILFDLYDLYETVNDIRNRIAHGCLEDPTAPFRSDIDKYLNYLTKTRKLLDSEELYNLKNIIALEEIKTKQKK